MDTTAQKENAINDQLRQLREILPPLLTSLPLACQSNQLFLLRATLSEPKCWPSSYAFARVGKVRSTGLPPSRP